MSQHYEYRFIYIIQVINSNLGRLTSKRPTGLLLTALWLFRLLPALTQPTRGVFMYGVCFQE